MSGYQGGVVVGVPDTPDAVSPNSGYVAIDGDGSTRSNSGSRQANIGGYPGRGIGDDVTPDPNPSPPGPVTEGKPAVAAEPAAPAAPADPPQPNADPEEQGEEGDEENAPKKESQGTGDDRDDAGPFPMEEFEAQAATNTAEWQVTAPIADAAITAAGLDTETLIRSAMSGADMEDSLELIGRQLNEGTEGAKETMAHLDTLVTDAIKSIGVDAGLNSSFGAQTKLLGDLAATGIAYQDAAIAFVMRGDDSKLKSLVTSVLDGGATPQRSSMPSTNRAGTWSDGSPVEGGRTLPDGTQIVKLKNGMEVPRKVAMGLGARF